MKKIFQSLTFRIVLLVIAVCVFMFAYFLFTGTTDVEEKKLIAEPAELTLEMNDSVQIRVYLYDLESGEKEDVTDQAEWTTSNPDIAVVGNKSVKGQVIASEKGGEVVITVTYNNQIANILVKIIRPELEVECAARIMRDGGPSFEDTARVGETIHWVSVYNKWGAPNYIYKWTGTDNLNDNGAIAIKVYGTLGLKEAKFFTEDTAGTTAEAVCSIIIIE